MTITIAALLALAPPALPAAPATAPAAKPGSPQAIFDAATAALAARKPADALAGFETLEARDAVRSNPAVDGAVKARKAAALIDLDRGEDA